MHSSGVVAAVDGVVGNVGIVVVPAPHSFVVEQLAQEHTRLWAEVYVCR